jgi:chemotaxis protein CheC
MENVTQLDELIIKIQNNLNEALRSITRKPVCLELKHSGIMQITEAQSLLENIQGQVTAVYIPIINDVIGDIFVFLPVELAHNIADILIGNEPGTTKVVGDFESSALKEFGNITFGVIITQLANALNLPMMLTVPNLATDNASALLDQVLIEYGETANDMLAIQMPFTIENVANEGSFIMLFDKKSSDMISSKLVESKTNPIDSTLASNPVAPSTENPAPEPSNHAEPTPPASVENQTPEAYHQDNQNSDSSSGNFNSQNPDSNAQMPDPNNQNGGGEDSGTY